MSGYIFYTDGSARPNPGYIGSGIHGYQYELTDKPVKTDDSFHIHTNFGYRKVSDITKLNQDNPSAKVEFVKPVKFFDIAIPSASQLGNDYSELFAIYNALQIAMHEPLSCIKIYSDSMYAIKAVSVGCKIWSKQDWKKSDGTSPANLDLLKKINELLVQIYNSSITLVIDWVKGHAEVFGNIHADTLSVIGMNSSRMGFYETIEQIAPAVGYWNSNIERHPLLHLKRLVFNSVSHFNTLGHYIQVEPGDADTVYGKRNPDAVFSILEIEEPDPYIELIKERQYQVANGKNAIVLMQLDNVFSKHCFRDLKRFGKPFLLHSSNINMNLMSANSILVTEEQNPTGLSLRAAETIDFLEDIFQQVKQLVVDSNAPNPFKIEITDITHLFYHDVTSGKNNDKVKKELKPEYIVGFTDMTIPVKINQGADSREIIVPYVLGKDSPPRNSLKRIEGLCPELHLITWRESDAVLRYATLVRCIGDIGIWSNHHSNRIFL